VFCYGVYERFARYARGSDDPTARLDDLPRRVWRAAALALSNRKQLDRDGAAFVVGVGMALYRRYGRRLDRLWGPHTSREDGRKTGGFEDDIEIVGLTELLAEALRSRAP